jgi:hypothetical protein
MEWKAAPDGRQEPQKVSMHCGWEITIVKGLQTHWSTVSIEGTLEGLEGYYMF